jgi:glyceraldehyde 3-phosphate dehydrogenase
MVDLVAELGKNTTADEINAVLRAAAAGPMQGVLGVSDEELVSMDYLGDPRSSIVDSASTLVMDGNFVKIIAWYDNEWGYSCRVVDLIKYMASKA